jgi:uncharacterized protein (TIGR02453 family)
MADFRGFPKETFAFLRGLSKNNKKLWFDAHKDDYENFYVAPAVAFIEALGPRLKKLSKRVEFEARAGGSLMRIYRDVRFSKDKRPYKDHLDLFFWEGRNKGWDAPGFFMRLTKDEVWLGTGMHHFMDPKRVASYRRAVDDDAKGKKLATLVAKLRKAGYTVGGEELKKVPKGFEPDHPRAALLKHKGLFAMAETTPKNAQGKGFIAWCAKEFETLEPINEWLRS